MGLEALVLPSLVEQAWSGLQPEVMTARAQDWPAQLRGELVWGPESFRSEDQFILTLNEEEISEIQDALENFNDLGLYGSEISPANFHLPTLGPKLLRVAKDVHYGKGFAVIRGLRPDDFSAEDNALLFLGVSSYIGAKRGRQDEEGNMMVHIQNAKLSKAAQTDRPTRYSSRASTFHTDTFCDILALHTRTCAAQGGRNILSSSWTVYNKLMLANPELRKLFAQPIWGFDSRGDFIKSSTRPLLFHHDHRVLVNFAREPLLGLAGVERPESLPQLTTAQQEALDIVEELARQNQIMVDAEPGDMLFINNHAILHSREAFADAPGEAPPRHLVRMWLKNPDMAWTLPRELQEGNSRIYDDNELGERWNIVDVPRFDFKLSERLTS